MASHNLSFTQSYFLDDAAAHSTDQAYGTCIGDLVSDMKTYHMEFDVEREIGKPPACFIRELGDSIASYVIFRDPNNNEIEIRVVAKTNKIYFTDGWHRLNDLYDIPFGAWITLTYISSSLLTIRVTNRLGIEVKYPTHNPPLRYLLEKNEPIGTAPTTARMHLYHGRLPRRSFVRSYVKKLTHYDVQSGTLILPWHGFGEAVFTLKFSQLILVDYDGNYFYCNMTFTMNASNEYCCRLSDGWSGFCKRYRLAEGDRVRFCVNVPLHNYTMYVSVYPQLGMETVLSYPLNDGTQLPLYVSQRFFLQRS